MRPPHTIFVDEGDSKKKKNSRSSSSGGDSKRSSSSKRNNSEKMADHYEDDSRSSGRDRHRHSSHRSSHRRSRRGGESRSRSRSRSRSPGGGYHSSRSRGRSGSGSGNDYHSNSAPSQGVPSGVPTGIPQPVNNIAMGGGVGVTNLLGVGGPVPPLANPTTTNPPPLSAYAAAQAPIASNNNDPYTPLITGGIHQLSPQEKINRELFVGNTPPGTSEALLMQFLNGAMRRVGLCSPNATPILACRTNAKFAFVELASVDDANKALNLNGIPFLGASLRVSRPSKYAGPHIPSQTWQQLTGQPLPPGMTPVPENNGSNPADKLERELFVGNTTPEMTGPMITDFLGRAMEQVGLTTQPGNPILACRISGKFAFVELRSIQEAKNALNLNNIPYLGAQLRVSRPTKYTGPETPHGNWEDILAKFMSGELQLNNSAGGMQAQAASVAAPAPLQTTAVAPPSVAMGQQQQQQQPTPVVELKQMLTLEDLTDDAEYEDILEDTRDECSSFGTLKNIIIPRNGPGATKIFLEYTSVEDAGKAISGLAGRTFDGRKVEAAYFDAMKFANQDYSD